MPCHVATMRRQSLARIKRVGTQVVPNLAFAALTEKFHAEINVVALISTFRNWSLHLQRESCRLASRRHASSASIWINRSPISESGGDCRLESPRSGTVLD